MSVKWFNYIQRTETESDDRGLNPSFWLTHRSLAKTNQKNSFLFINEWVCANLGWYLRLPIPPFSLLRKADQSQRYFASMDFGGNSRRPCDMNPARFCECLPEESAMIVVFDVLCANPDRHEKNLKVDKRHNPTTYELFDHDQALLASTGFRRLDIVQDRLGLTLLNSTTRDFHKFASHIKSHEDLSQAVTSIGDIPDAFIDSICNETTSLDLNKGESRDLAAFLKNRKNKVGDLIQQNKSFFPSIPNWGLFL